MSASADFEAVDAATAPDEFQITAGYELTPEDAGTPPAEAMLFMSPEFTNPEGADADRGKTRDYAVVIQYPPGVENTVVRMNDCPTVHGSRIFRQFVESTAEKHGYVSERVPVEEYLSGGLETPPRL